MNQVAALQFDLFGDQAEPGPASAAGCTVTVAGREFETSPVFDTYWRFAAARQKIYEARIAGRPAPWTDDPVLRGHRFTNCYRASDRVSQFVIRDVAYCGDQNPSEVVFRVLLFKLFNKIETWRLLVAELGTPGLDSFDLDRYGAVLDEAFARGQRLYSAAYVMPAPPFGQVRKHRNHLHLLEHMMSDGLAATLARADSMRAAFEAIKRYPGCATPSRRITALRDARVELVGTDDRCDCPSSRHAHLQPYPVRAKAVRL